MQKTIVKRPEIMLVGISVRTSNEKEFNKNEGNISRCVQRYFHEGLFNKIDHRKNPGTTICAYTDYESDHTGPYTYFIGEEVNDVPEKLQEGFEVLLIPAQNYAKFTTPPGPMPDVVIDGWKKIWNMSPKEFGGKRSYQTDFELYDERANDHANVIMDLYICLEV